MRERDESAYVDDDGNEQDVNNDAAASNNLNDDNGDTQATLVAKLYKLSAKAIARYRASYPWFDHDATTGKSCCSTCKLWGGSYCQHAWVRRELAR